MRWVQQLQWRYRKWLFRRARAAKEGADRPGLIGSGHRRVALALTLAGVVFAVLAGRAWLEGPRAALPVSDPTAVGHPLFLAIVLISAGALVTGYGTMLRRALAWTATILFVAGVGYLWMSFILLFGSWVNAWPIALIVFLALMAAWSWWLGRPAE